MEFDLDEDQVSLRDVVRGVAEAECPTTVVRAVIGGDDAVVDTLWKSYVGLDWPGLAVAEGDGGVGLTLLELALALEELGRLADPTPLLATTSQYLPLVQSCASDEQRGALVGEILAGLSGAASFDASTVSAERVGDDWRVTGIVPLVVDGDRADRLALAAIADGGPAVFILDADQVTATRTNTFDGTLHVAQVQVDGAVVPAARALTGPAAAEGIRDAELAALVGIAATMVGASQKIFELATGHIRERKQFGVPIGSFQAVKHMAVDVYVAIERARALVHFAARAIAEGEEHRVVAASMAKAAAGECQKLTARHGIQLFGGLGFTWENDLQIFVRHAKVGELLFGSAASHRARVAVDESARDGLGGSGPADDEATTAFLAELVAWLDEHKPSPEETTERPGSSAHVPPWAREWQREMFDAGWLVPGNAPEFGGRNATLLQQFAHLEELDRQGITNSFNPQGLSIIVPSILAFGTDEQKQKWAVPILRTEITAALGMSEPDAGSDLAGLRTKATLEGDHFRVNGQKVWTSGAHDADVILTFVRTDPDAAKHKGLSVLMIPTDLPGVTRRPFGSVVEPEDLDFNEVFFDDVLVPAENLIGPLNQGWTVATGSLGHERAMLWQSFAARLDHLIANAPAALDAAGVWYDPLVRDRFGEVIVDAYALRLLGYRGLLQAARGKIGPEQSILKLLGSEAVQRGTLDVLEALGTYGLDPETPSSEQPHLVGDHWGQGWFNLYLRSFAGTIAGGTSQIQRNIVAERVLGLPRS